MTPEAQRVAIAEACGLKCKRCNGTGGYLRYGEHEWFRMNMKMGTQAPMKCDHVTEDEHLPFERLFPDYLNDLNACHEMEKTLNHKQSGEYVVLLNGTSKAFLMFELLHASAAQRAEAFLRTIGKWEE